MNSDRLLLRGIYDHRRAIISYLMGKYHCDEEKADTIFIESALIIRKKHLDGTLGEIAQMESYIVAVCNNVWMRYYTKEMKMHKASDDVARYFYGHLEERGINETEVKEVKEELFGVLENALETLGEKCRKIIRYFYYEKKTMTQIAALLEFKSQSVAITSKYRCFLELKEKAMDMKRKLDQK